MLPDSRAIVSAEHRRQVPRSVWRAINAIAKLRAGLPLHGENVSPEVPNDLFQAHLAIYCFAATFAPGAHALDVGSGTGYGAAHLLAKGAREVVGIDRDERSVRYARRRFGQPGLTFVTADAESLDPRWSMFDLIIASNVLEHLTTPAEAILTLSGRLSCHGRLLAALPPITDEWTLRENEKNPYHRSNLYVHEWLALFAASFGEVQVLRQIAAPGVEPDFANPAPSRLSPASFEFVACSTTELADPCTIGALFLCSRPAAPTSAALRS